MLRESEAATQSKDPYNLDESRRLRFPGKLARLFTSRKNRAIPGAGQASER